MEFETKLNSVHIGDKFLVTSKDTLIRDSESRVREILVTDIYVSKISGVTYAKYKSGPNSIGEMPVCILTGEECELGNGRYQYVVTKLSGDK